MNEFIAIDFETGKYSPESAVSIGLVKYFDFQPVASYYSLIRPPKLYIRQDFTDIHGLTVDDVRNAPDFKDIWGDITGFIGEASLAAHNASFDMGVLKAVLEWYELTIPDLSYFCTRNLARNTWTGLESYALTALAKKFRIHYNAHNALDDAMTCGKLVVMSSEKFGIKKSIKELIDVAGIEMGFLK